MRSALLCLLLGGCPDELDVCLTPTDNTASSFAFALAEGDDCAAVPAITTVTISSFPDGQVLWHFTAGQGQALSAVQYGVLPAGFSQAVEAIPLTAGQKIHIAAETKTTSGGIDTTLD